MDSNTVNAQKRILKLLAAARAEQRPKTAEEQSWETCVLGCMELGATVALQGIAAKYSEADTAVDVYAHPQLVTTAFLRSLEEAVRARGGPVPLLRSLAAVLPPSTFLYLESICRHPETGAPVLQRAPLLTATQEGAALQLLHGLWQAAEGHSWSVEAEAWLHWSGEQSPLAAADMPLDLRLPAGCQLSLLRMNEREAAADHLHEESTSVLTPQIAFWRSSELLAMLESVKLGADVLYDLCIRQHRVELYSRSSGHV